MRSNLQGAGARAPLLKHKQRNSSIDLACLLARIGLIAMLAAHAAAADIKRQAPGLAEGLSAGSIDLRKGISATHRLTIGTDVLALRIAMVRLDAEFTMKLTLENSSGVTLSPMLEDEELEWRAESNDGVHLVIVADRFSSPPLLPGKYELEISYDFYSEPFVAGRTVQQIEYELDVDIVREGTPIAIELGHASEGNLDPDAGGVAVFEIAIPAATPVVRLDLSSVSADIELLASFDAIPRSLAKAPYQAITRLGLESIVISEPAETPRRLFIVVLDALDAFQPIPFTLHASASSNPPAALLEIPPFPELPAANDSLSRALSATVEVFAGESGGSATLLGDRGFLLTNWHVVANPSGGVQGESNLVIAVPMDLVKPPRELFRAKVVQSDPRLDLALLRITTGFYGQPLPDGYRFPGIALDRAASSSLRIGEDLYHIGFPAVGGTESRASITVTRGLLSGLQEFRGEVMLKSQSIFTGNSGGGTYDMAGRLVGVPSQSVGSEDDSGHMGYALAVSAIPAEWLAQITAKE